MNTTRQTPARTGTFWDELADQALAGKLISRDDALAILQADDRDVLAVLDAAYRVRHHYFGNRVKLCMLINAMSGLCSEDCAYCSQSKVSTAQIEKYSMVDQETILESARHAAACQALNFSIVISGRGPAPRLVETVAAAVKEIKATTPLEVCASLGILAPGQAEQLKEAGLDRCHHNLNTSARFHSRICSTHSYEDRVATIEEIKRAGLSVCCGIIVGMGETHEDIVDLAGALRELDADSIPVNFLNPIPGTPLAETRELTPMFCLKVLALFRFICPDKEIRVAGGREVNLRALQPLVLFPASAMFVGDYLTTEGRGVAADQQMIADLGFDIVGPAR